MPAPDPFDLDRFVAAQEGVYETALRELAEGRKRTHWIWFVFPQIEGLGKSAIAQRYAIGSLEAARAYLAHPVLGLRLKEAVLAALTSPTEDAHALFGSLDDLKFRSCLTLFAEADPREAVFARALDAFYDGQRDPKTLERLGRAG